MKAAYFIILRRKTSGREAENNEGGDICASITERYKSNMLYFQTY